MKYLSILAALALLASCTNSENAPGTGDSEQPVPVSLSAGIAPTRVVNDEWTAGDAIGLSLYAAGTTEPASPAVLNYRYLATTTGATTGFSPATTQQTAYYTTTGAQVDLLAYYPYAATLNPDGTLPLDVSRQQSLPAIDLMSATATADKGHPNVALRFSHRLTRLVFSISGKGSVSTASLAGATLTIRGMDTRADYNLHTDTYITVDDADADAGAADDAAGNTSSTTAASGDNNTSPQDISVPLNASGTQGNAIVLPRSAAAGVSFIITLTDGSHFTAHLSDTHELKAGTSNLFRITLSPESVSITATINPWEDAPETDLSTSPVTIAAATTSSDSNSGDGGGSGNGDGSGDGSETSFSPGSQFTLWAGSPTGTGTLFTLGTDGQWSTASPLYWDAYPAASTTFHALHLPADTPAGNQMPDVMAATAPTERFAPVTLAFAHLTAQLNVTLKPGAGITSEALQTATVTVPQAITAYELKGITLTPGTTRADVTLSGTRDRRHALLLPQTITAGQPLLRLTIGGQTYRLDATARNGAFEAGKSYTLNVTVSNAEITATVSINPWLTGGDSEGDAGMEI